MIQCFNCKAAFQTCNLLINHFKQYHGLNNRSEIRCGQKDCEQYFNNFKAFRKHLEKVHTLEVKCDSIQNVACGPSLIKDYVHNVHQERLLEERSAADICDVPANENEFETESCSTANPSAIFLNSAFQFTLYLLSENSMPRSQAFNIQQNIDMLIMTPLINMLKKFSENNLCNNAKASNELNDIISNCRNLFHDVGTEYKVDKKLISLNLMEKVQDIVIKKSIEPFHKNGVLKYGTKSYKGCITPLKFYFKKIFEKDNLLEKMLSNMNNLESSENYKNFVNGQLWKNKKSLYPEKTLIPYFLYLDDIEVNNPLGAHAGTHSVCNIYISFPCFPSKESKLDNIFLAGTFKSKDLKQYGSERCLNQLIEALIDLEMNGLSIDNNHGARQIHFVLGLIAGDNLGLNNALEFIGSFSANFYCRFCKASNKDCQTMCSERQELQRDRVNYFEDVAIYNSSVTDVNRNCIFNKIPSFHATENFYVDTMHDIFEGVCHYDLSLILNHFIEKKKYFNITTLNNRKQNFNYGPNEIGNISLPITDKHIAKRHFKMSAAEMLTFAI